jgi:hypothetical protein
MTAPSLLPRCIGIDESPHSPVAWRRLGRFTSKRWGPGMRGLNHRAIRPCLFVLLLCALAACSNGPVQSGSPVAQTGTPSPTNSTQTAQSSVALVKYSTTTFVIPFDVVLPPWLATKPSATQSNFVTWESKDRSRAVRFMSPVSVFRPGEAKPSSVPRNYLSYLLGQRRVGAQFTDKEPVDVDNKLGTVLNATTSKKLDGSVGCQKKGLSAGDCYGLQRDVIVRIVVVDVHGQTLLAWLRQDRGASAESLQAGADSFDQLMQSLRFSDRPVKETNGTAKPMITPIDGVWKVSLTRKELASSPLVDPGEINDDNWGQLTITFKNGQFQIKQKNALTHNSSSGKFHVENHILFVNADSGEQFIMRWTVRGDKLTLTRDDSLGDAPTGVVIKPWMRQN